MEQRRRLHQQAIEPKSSNQMSQFRYQATQKKCGDNSVRKKPHKTLKIRAGKMAVTVEILPR